MTNYALPSRYQNLLAVLSLIVPISDRDDWRRVWHSEIWDIQHRRRVVLRAFADIATGMFSDAAWLRAEALRLRFAGSPLLCLVTLTSLCLLCLQFGAHFTGSVHIFLFSFGLQLRGPYLLGAAIAISVTVLTTADDRTRYADIGQDLPAELRVKRTSFFFTKLGLALTLGLLFTAVLLAAFHLNPRWTILPQIYFSAVFVASTLRWAVWDQHQRCQHCLHALAMPSRIGRPSHNLLEWNGTQRTCRHGHGSLREPEMQTSWQESSRWVIS